MTRIAPHSIEAEDALVGAALLSRAVLPEVVNLIDASDFFQPRGQIVWAEIERMYRTGQPVDVVTVSEALRDAKMIDAVWLQECMNAMPAISNARQYASIIVEYARRRRLIAHAAEITDQAYQLGNDLEEVVGMATQLDPALLPRQVELSRLHGDISAWRAAAEQRDPAEDWLIPHILRPRWRAILVAAEGIGKATYMRQIGLHAAAGLDPHDPSRRIMPIRVLYVDAENPTDAILQQHVVVNRRLRLDDMAGDMYQMWHVEGGVNLRERRARIEFEAVLERSRPQLVLAGPLYKLFARRAGEDMEQGTLEFLQIMDHFRERFGFALMLEHHAPKAQGGAYRQLDPFGSSTFLRWPEFGLSLQDHGDGRSTTGGAIHCELQRFRMDRVAAEWPAELTRGEYGSTLAWSPTFRFSRGTKIGARWMGDDWAYDT